MFSLAIYKNTTAHDQNTGKNILSPVPRYTNALKWQNRRSKVVCQQIQSSSNQLTLPHHPIHTDITTPGEYSWDGFSHRRFWVDSWRPKTSRRTSRGQWLLCEGLIGLCLVERNAQTNKKVNISERDWLRLDSFTNMETPNHFFVVFVANINRGLVPGPFINLKQAKDSQRQRGV